MWDSDIPLVVCRSYGLTAYIRLVLKEHTSQLVFHAVCVTIKSFNALTLSWSVQ